MFFGLTLWVIRFGQLHIWKCIGKHMKALRLGFPTMRLVSQTDTLTDFGVKITLRRQWRRKQRLGSIYTTPLQPLTYVIRTSQKQIIEIAKVLVY